MAPNEEITMLKQLKAMTGFCSIKVKIHLMWDSYYPDNKGAKSAVDMVLEDEKGDRILANVKKYLLSTFEKVLKEGSAFILSNFGITSNGAYFKVVDNEHKIIFWKGTIVQPCNDFHGSGDHFRYFDFHDVQTSIASKTISYDVLGRVVSSRELRLLKVSGKEKKILKFQLQDLSGQRISCALWDEFADKLQEYIKQNSVEKNPVVILIQLGKFCPFDGVPQVSNNNFGARLFINDEKVEPLKDFLDSVRADVNEDSTSDVVLQLSSNTVVTNPEDYYNKFQVKHIHELFSLDKQMDCSVVAKLINIEPKHGWFYYACRECELIVVKTEEGSALPYHCETCKKDVSDVYPIMKVNVWVQDPTGTVEFTLFEREITRQINRSSASMVEKMQKIKKIQPYREEFKVMLDTIYAFKIRVYEYNIVNDYHTFTVNKMSDETSVIQSLLTKAPHNDPDYPEFLTANSVIEVSQIGSETKDVASVTAENGTPGEVLKSTATSPGTKRSVEDVDGDPGLMSSTSKTYPVKTKFKQPKLEAA